MYVIGVGQIQSRVQGFMTDNQCIGNRRFHQCGNTVQLPPGKIPPFQQQIPFPFIIDLGAPSGSVKALPASLTSKSRKGAG